MTPNNALHTNAHESGARLNLNVRPQRNGMPTEARAFKFNLRGLRLGDGIKSGVWHAIGGCVHGEKAQVHEH